jgi:type III secretion system low calcium response chaperone LcrH/SycD
MEADVYKKALENFDITNPLSWADMYDLITNFTNQAPTFKELLNPPPELLQNLYDMAGYLYYNQKYEVARKIYEILYYYDAKNSVFVFSIAACEQALGRINEAISYYLLSSSLDKKNPEPLYYAGELSLVLNQKESAYQFFRQVVNLAKDDKKFVAIKDRSEAILMAAKK